MPDLQLVPRAGILSTRIFENKNAGILPTLFFDIEIPIEPFDFLGDQHDTTVVLNFIKFGVRNWRELSGRTFEFPKNPIGDYIDGSVFLDNAHNPVDVTKIQFGSFEAGAVTANLKFEIDFTLEGPSELGKVVDDWSVKLAFSELDLETCCSEAVTRGIGGKPKPRWKFW